MTVPDDDLLINDDLSFLEIVQPRVDRELAEQLISFWRTATVLFLVLLVVVWIYYRNRIYLFYFGPKIVPGFASPRSRAMTPVVLSPKTRGLKIET